VNGAPSNSEFIAAVVKKLHGGAWGD
jgi:hypothetical protein